MHDRLEHGDERRAVGEVEVELGRWIIECGSAPRASTEVHGVEVADRRVLGVPGLQDLRAALARPPGAGEENAVPGGGAPEPCDSDGRAREDGDGREGPED